MMLCIGAHTCISLTTHTHTHASHSPRTRRYVQDYKEGHILHFKNPGSTPRPRPSIPSAQLPSSTKETNKSSSTKETNKSSSQPEASPWTGQSLQNTQGQEGQNNEATRPLTQSPTPVQITHRDSSDLDIDSDSEKRTGQNLDIPGNIGAKENNVTGQIRPVYGGIYSHYGDMDDDHDSRESDMEYVEYTWETNPLMIFEDQYVHCELRVCAL